MPQIICGMVAELGLAGRGKEWTSKAWKSESGGK